MCITKILYFIHFAVSSKGQISQARINTVNCGLFVDLEYKSSSQFLAQYFRIDLYLLFRLTPPPRPTVGDR